MNSRGFTLIELVVTLGIMVVITSVTLANYNKFGGKVLLRTTAYEMALAAREAQTYGISVRKVGFINYGSGLQTVLDADTYSEFQPAYGLHFSAGSPTSYTMFADTYKDNGIISRGEDGLRNTNLEDVTIYNIGKGYKINKLCAGTDGKCVSVCESCTGSLDITFKRPEPDASIRFGGDTNKVYDKANIELISPRGDSVHVLVEVSGQISVIR
jgi:prepilin-type N-terminal cleavage/methylation domain-containing protein